MSDFEHGGSGSDAPPPAPTPPPGFAGGPPIAPPPGSPPGGFGGGPPTGSPGYQPPTVVNPYAVPAPVERTPREPYKPARRSILPFLLGLVAIVAVGAGAVWFLSSDDEDQKAEELGATGPGAAVLTTFTALADKDYAAACESMSASAIERVTATGESCPDEMARLSPGDLYAKADESKILRVVIKGDRAQVNVEVGGSPLPDTPIGATREDGTWKTDFGSFGPAYVNPTDEWFEESEARILEEERQEDAAAVEKSEKEADVNEEAQEGDPSENPGSGFLAWAEAIRTGDHETACKYTASYTIESWKDEGWACLDAYAASDAEYDFVNSDKTVIKSIRKTSKDVARVFAETSQGDRVTTDFEYRMEFEDGLWKYDSERTFR